MSAGHKWKPLTKRQSPTEASPEAVAAYVEHYGGTPEEARASIIAHQARCEYWRNDLYQVEVNRGFDGESSVWICIRRTDGYPGRDWRHFQQIKNEIVGPECEAVELYPAESRLTDTSNKYHLFASTDPTFRFLFGYTTRDVQFDDHTKPGMRQRPPMQHAGGER